MLSTADGIIDEMEKIKLKQIFSYLYTRLSIIVRRGERWENSCKNNNHHYHRGAEKCHDRIIFLSLCSYQGLSRNVLLMKSMASSDTSSKSSSGNVKWHLEILRNVSCLSSLPKGLYPVRRTYASTPTLHRSVFNESGSYWTISCNLKNLIKIFVFWTWQFDTYRCNIFGSSLNFTDVTITFNRSRKTKIA